MLALFLIASAIHFGESEPRLPLAGLWVVAGSLIVFTEPTLAIFEELSQTELSHFSTPARVLALTIGIALGVQAALRRDIAYAALLLGIFCLLDPVSAVALYYFAIHSLREWRETHAVRGTIDSMMKLYAPFSVPVFIGGAATITAAYLGWISTPTAAGFAIAIALPHMVPLERVLTRSRGPARPTKARTSAH